MGRAIKSERLLRSPPFNLRMYVVPPGEMFLITCVAPLHALYMYFSLVASSRFHQMNFERARNGGHRSHDNDMPDPTAGARILLLQYMIRTEIYDRDGTRTRDKDTHQKCDTRRTHVKFTALSHGEKARLLRVFWSTTNAGVK